MFQLRPRPSMCFLDLRCLSVPDDDIPYDNFDNILQYIGLPKNIFIFWKYTTSGACRSLGAATADIAEEKAGRWATIQSGARRAGYERGIGGEHSHILTHEFQFAHTQGAIWVPAAGLTVMSQDISWYSPFLLPFWFPPLRPSPTPIFESRHPRFYCNIYLQCKCAPLFGRRCLGPSKYHSIQINALPVYCFCFEYTLPLPLFIAFCFE